MLSRKEFLKNAAIISASASILSIDNLFGLSTSSKNKSINFDFHTHPGWSLATGFPSFDSEVFNKTLSEMVAGNVTSAFITLIADAPLLKMGTTGINITRKYSSGEAWTEYKSQLNQIKSAYNNVQVKLTTDLRDLNQNNEKIAGLIAVEGGDFLEGKVNRLEEVYQDGVRSIQLVHYVQNDLGDLQTSESTFNGLSAFGKELVPRMNQIGMVIDMAHASFQTTKDVAKLTKAPIIISHSILEMEANRPIAKRAISKEHAKLIAETDGVIGAWPSGFNKNFDEYVDNIKRLVDVVGIDHVGIGTDMDGNFKPVLSSYSQFPQLANVLKTKGFSSTEVRKIMGENAKTVFKKIFKK